MIAYEGHIDELKAIYGTSEPETTTVPVESAQDFLKAFGSKGVKRK